MIRSAIGIVGFLSLVFPAPPSAAQQYGATTAKPYTQADIDYGRKLQAKIDKARSDSTGVIAKMPIEPFHVVGDVYDIGVHNWGVYIVTTPKGLIMLDTGWNDTAELLQRNIEKLGFSVTDIKIILMTEWHGDHNAGVAYFKQASGAQVMVMDDDVKFVEQGSAGYPPAKVDRILHDRDTVSLGGKTLTAYHIPGHTPGSTTWYWQESEGGVTYNVGDVCCWFTPANVVSDPEYPTKLLEKDWAALKSLPVDIPLPGIHHYHFDYLGKMARARAGEKNVWVDPQGYRGVIAAFEQDFKDKVAEQTKNGPPPARAGGPPPPGGPPAKPFAITNVRIFDGTNTTEKGTVYVADGKISAAGANVTVPAGTATVDGTGKTVIPGLIDSHVHMAEGYFTAGAMALEQAMTFGVTTVMDMAVSNSQDYKVYMRKVKANEFLTAADMFTAGVGASVAGGHGAVRDAPALLFTSPEMAQPWVDGRASAGSYYIKILYETFQEHGRNVPTLTDDEIKGITAAAHKDGLLAVAHTLQEDKARRAVLDGVDGLVHISPYDSPSPDFGKFLAAHHIFQSTNLISYAPVSYKKELSEDPDLTPYMGKAMIADLASATPFADARHEYSMAALKEIHEAGVPVLAGTDIGYPYAPLLHAELEIMVKDGGFTPAQALATATSNPAKAYPMLADRGRIAPGLRADLLLLDGDPTKDILATRKIVRIWRQGKEVNREALKAEVTAPELPRGGPGGPPPGAAPGGPGGAPRSGAGAPGAAPQRPGAPPAGEHDDIEN